MEDSRGDYVFFEREKKTNSPKKIRRFPSSSPSPSHHFLAKSPSSANFWVGHLNGSLRNKKSYLPRRTWGGIYAGPVLGRNGKLLRDMNLPSRSTFFPIEIIRFFVS